MVGAVCICEMSRLWDLVSFMSKTGCGHFGSNH
jgi:hypothetical protein